MSTQGQLTATTSSQTLIASNAARLGILVKSMPTNSDLVYLNFIGAAATTAAGIPLAPGESVFWTTDFGQIQASDWSSDVTVIGTAGGEDVRWVEFSS